MRGKWSESVLGALSGGSLGALGHRGRIPAGLRTGRGYCTERRKADGYDPSVAGWSHPRDAGGRQHRGKTKPGQKTYRVYTCRMRSSEGAQGQKKRRNKRTTTMERARERYCTYVYIFFMITFIQNRQGKMKWNRHCPRRVMTTARLDAPSRTATPFFKLKTHHTRGCCWPCRSRSRR